MPLPGLNMGHWVLCLHLCTGPLGNKQSRSFPGKYFLSNSKIFYWNVFAVFQFFFLLQYFVLNISISVKISRIVWVFEVGTNAARLPPAKIGDNIFWRSTANDNEIIFSRDSDSRSTNVRSSVSPFVWNQNPTKALNQSFHLTTTFTTTHTITDTT